MENIRAKRVASRFFHEISQMMLSEVRDPRLSGVRVTRVVVTPDLHIAKVYFVLDHSGIPREVLRRLKRSIPYFRRELGRRVELRHTPEIHFFYDDMERETAKLEGLFTALHQENETKDTSPRSDS